MPRAYLVRHGHAAAGWGDHPDPGLDDLGRKQAEGAAGVLAGSIAPCRVLTSPLARAQQTATPLCEAWSTTAEVAAAFGEIPSPSSDLTSRSAWLGDVLSSRWGDLDEPVQRWRARLLDAVVGLESDTVVFTHFVAINAVAAHALDRPDVTVFLPENASITVVEVAAGSSRIEVVSLGREAEGTVG